jgi:nucleoside-diphosphate-sugar epimerase
MNRIVGTSIEALYTDPRPGDVRDSQADITKARHLLGYAPIVSFEQGLERTITWCRADRAAASGR